MAVAATESAIGDQAPLWITVSPDYAHSHMVAALTAEMGCQRRCMHLWVTRDGGGHWHDSHLPFDAAHVAVLTNGSAREVVLVEGPSALERTDDDGATWRAVGAPGIPATMGGEVAAVAVPGGHDFEATPLAAIPVDGSGGSETDLSFAASATDSELLAVADISSGADMVERCDANLRCAYGTPLPGARSADVQLVLDSRFSSDGVALARTPTTLYRSTNAGVTFAPVALPSLQSASYTTVAAVSAAPDSQAAHDSIYVALLGVVQAGSTASTAGGVYRSDDVGASWHAVDAGGPLHDGATAVAAAPDGRIFAGYVNSEGRAGLVCSADGRAWAAGCPPISMSCDACSKAPGGPDGATVPGPSDDGPLGDASQDGRSHAAAGRYSPQMATTGGGGSGFYVFLVALLIGIVVLAVPLSTLRRRPR